MRLIYKDTYNDVAIGDTVQLDGQPVIIRNILPPRSAASTGRIAVSHDLSTSISQADEFYSNIFGAEWIEREDRLPWMKAVRVEAQSAVAADGRNLCLVKARIDLIDDELGPGARYFKQEGQWFEGETLGPVSDEFSRELDRFVASYGHSLENQKAS